MAMRDIILNGLVSRIPGMRVNGDITRGLYNTLSVSLPGIHAHEMIKRLDEYGIEAAGGSACSKGKPSEVLAALGLSEAQIHATLRISLSENNTPSECNEAAEAIVRIWRGMTQR